MSCTNLKKESADPRHTLSGSPQAEYTMGKVRAIKGTFPMYILLLASFRGGDSRAIEQIY